MPDDDRTDPEGFPVRKPRPNKPPAQMCMCKHVSSIHTISGCRGKIPTGRPGQMADCPCTGFVAAR